MRPPDLLALLTHSPAARALYYGERALAGLRALGTVRLHEGDEALEGAALIEAARGCAIVISDRRTAAGADLFAACPDLVVWQRCAMDIRNVDVAAASRHGVLVTRASAGFGNAVAEWTIGVLIDLARGISASVQAHRNNAAPPIVMGRELRGSALGIIGYGHIGRRLAELGLALGMRVLVHDPHVDLRVDAGTAVTALPLDDLLAASDHVVCLAPALPETENLMDARRFAQMKRGAVFVNPSRGNLVDEAALLAALDSGHLAGCALDVGRAPDQMPSPALARHPRVVATPHIGGLTPQAVEHQALETVAQLAALLRGEMPPGTVNAEHATRLARLRPTSSPLTDRGDPR
ncbi:MAG: hydroxyacid dehydrogenase [Rubrivivax sp.]|nr:hydroxyacid dehydrogenase [Rubrivivax sp.]MCL4696570.1 hydroxyacid dehydrogenase [Burkholderiaceae bacterium]